MKQKKTILKFGLSKRAFLKHHYSAMRFVHMYLRENKISFAYDKESVVVLKFAQAAFGEDSREFQDGYRSWLISKHLAGEIKRVCSGMKIMTAGERRDQYKKFLESKYWTDVVALVRIRDGGVCTSCGTTKFLTTHHKTYEHHREEHEHLEDLITLCWPCHKTEHIRLRREKINDRKKKKAPAIR